MNKVDKKYITLYNTTIQTTRQKLLWHSGVSRNVERRRGSGRCISLVVNYRKSTQWTLRVLYVKCDLLKKLAKANGEVGRFHAPVWIRHCVGLVAYYDIG